MWQLGVPAWRVRTEGSSGSPGRGEEPHFRRASSNSARIRQLEQLVSKLSKDLRDLRREQLRPKLPDPAQLLGILGSLETPGPRPGASKSRRFKLANKLQPLRAPDLSEPPSPHHETQRKPSPSLLPHISPPPYYNLPTPTSKTQRILVPQAHSPSRPFPTPRISDLVEIPQTHRDPIRKPFRLKPRPPSPAPPDLPLPPPSESPKRFRMPQLNIQKIQPDSPPDLSDGEPSDSSSLLFPLEKSLSRPPVEKSLHPTESKPTNVAPSLQILANPQESRPSTSQHSSDEQEDPKIEQPVKRENISKKTASKEITKTSFHKPTQTFDPSDLQPNGSKTNPDSPKNGQNSNSDSSERSSEVIQSYSNNALGQLELDHPPKQHPPHRGALSEGPDPSNPEPKNSTKAPATPVTPSQILLSFTGRAEKVIQNKLNAMRMREKLLGKPNLPIHRSIYINDFHEDQGQDVVDSHRDQFIKWRKVIPAASVPRQRVPPSPFLRKQSEFWHKPDQRDRPFEVTLSKQGNHQLRFATRLKQTLFRIRKVFWSVVFVSRIVNTLDSVSSNRKEICENFFRENTHKIIREMVRAISIKMTPIFERFFYHQRFKDLLFSVTQNQVPHLHTIPYSSLIADLFEGYTELFSEMDSHHIIFLYVCWLSRLHEPAGVLPPRELDGAPPAPQLPVQRAEA